MSSEGKAPLPKRLVLAKLGVGSVKAGSWITITLGQRMIKVVTAIKRRSDLSVEAFQDHWLNRHSEVVLRLPGILRYHQSHLRASGYAEGEPVYDGVAEVWFEDLAAMRALVGTAEHNALLEDEDRFLNRDVMVTLLTTEHVAKESDVPAGAIKCFELAKRRPDLSPEAFQAYWRETHGPLVARIPTLLRYVQAAPRSGGYKGGREFPYDAVTTIWFESTDTMRQGAASQAFADARSDEANFLASEPRVTLFTQEHVIKTSSN